MDRLKPVFTVPLPEVAQSPVSSSPEQDVVDASSLIRDADPSPPTVTRAGRVPRQVDRYQA